MIEHLVVSTAVLVAALLAARFIPMTARTRYALLLCALLKLAVPTAVFDLVPATVIPAAFRTFGGGTAATVTADAPRTNWFAIAYGVIAALLLARWLLLRARTISAALRNPSPASQRELDAVRDARIALRLRTAIDVVRSPLCEAPAVLRTIRPVIILPARGCDELEDDELRSLVLHECAHVARYDNVAALLQALATSIFWLHPLVWLTSGVLTTAREQACDEAVAEEMKGTESYLGAMTKVCFAIAAPRTAGVSCMASSNLKERTEHLMGYESIKRRALPHRGIVAASVLVLAFSTVALATHGGHGGHAGSGYKLHHDIRQTESGDILFQLEVSDSKGNLIVAPQVQTRPNEPATLRSGSEAGGMTRDIRIDVRGTHEAGEIKLEVTENGTAVHTTTTKYKHSSKAKHSQFTGEPISISVLDADIRDLMNTFSALTGSKIVVEPQAADARITLDVKGTPWDEVLDRIARENGLTITIEGKIIRVSKK
jgi:beta-lactamase regulating signal transducer with metallopeptidase domain